MNELLLLCSSIPLLLLPLLRLLLLVLLTSQHWMPGGGLSGGILIAGFRPIVVERIELETDGITLDIVSQLNSGFMSKSPVFWLSQRSSGPEEFN